MFWGLVIGGFVGGAIGGVVGFLGASIRFYRDNKAMANELKNQKALTNDANEHHKEALALCESYEERVDKATSGYRETAKEAAELAKKARKDYESAIKTARKEAWEAARREFVRRVPEPCDRCKGLGYYVGANNQSYECKHCVGDGEVVRIVKVKND